MSLVKLPINTGMVQAVDEVGLVTHGASMVDVFVDELGNINRRPGLVELCDLGTSAKVDGLYWWSKEGWMFAVSGGRLFNIYSSGGTFAEINPATGAFEIGKRVSFDDYGTAVYAANGGRILKIQASGTPAWIADADAPTTVSKLGILKRYLIAQEDGSGNFHHSDVNALDTWSGYWNEAEANPDNLLSVLIAESHIKAIGRKSMEVFHADGSSPFSPLDQSYVESGTIAADSFAYAKSQKALVWLDEERQGVILSGVTPVTISITMQKYIQGFTSVTDAQSDCISIGGRPYWILKFPTEGKTLVFDFTSKNWYEWGYWNSGAAEYDDFRGNCYGYSPDWNRVLVGDRANGKVYYFDSTTYTDNSSTLRSMVRTAHYNHGTEALLKTCNAVYFRLKRTNVVSADATPDLQVRYRNDGGTSWTDYETVSLQKVGNTEFRGVLKRKGSYYSRQWEFSLSDEYPLCLVSVEEDVDIEDA